MRAATADELQRPPRYRDTLVDPFRDHLRRRRAEDPGVPVTLLLAEIRELGYTGSANLLVRYLNQGRADTVRKPPSPRRLVAWLMTKTTDLPAHHQDHRHDLLTACAHLTVLAERVEQFACLLTERRGQDLEQIAESVACSVCAVAGATTVLNEVGSGADEKWRRQPSKYGPVQTRCAYQGRATR